MKNLMGFIKNILKKISIAESMTILFIFSIGISLLYKYGFYSTLGIDWYLYNLSPQELIISSIGIIFFFILGGVIGASKLFFKEEDWFIYLILLISFICIFGFSIILKNYQSTLLGVDLNKFSYYMKISMYTMLLSLFCIKLNQIDQPDNQGKFNEIVSKISPIIFFLAMFYFLIAVVYLKGVDDANLITSNHTSKKSVKLKDDSKTWVLVEISGDKVLIFSNDKSHKYKIVEYKDIEFYSVK